MFSSVIIKPSFSISTVKTLLSWMPSTVVPIRKWLRISKADKSGLRKKLLDSRSRNKSSKRNLTSLKSPKKIQRKMKSLDLELLLAEKQQRKLLRIRPRRHLSLNNKKYVKKKSVFARKRKIAKRKKKRKPKLPQLRREVPRNPQLKEKKSLRKLKPSLKLKNRE